MAKKFQFVKASVGELLSVNGNTLTNPTKLHAFKEADTENYIFGWEGDVSGCFHFFNKTSWLESPKKTINHYLSFSANITDSVYTAEKLTTATYPDDAEHQFQFDSIKAENITDVPIDINLKTGKSLLDTGTTASSNSNNPKTANTGLAALPTWSWFLIVPAVGLLVWSGIKALVKNKRKASHKSS